MKGAGLARGSRGSQDVSELVIPRAGAVAATGSDGSDGSEGSDGSNSSGDDNGDGGGSMASEIDVWGGTSPHGR